MYLFLILSWLPLWFHYLIASLLRPVVQHVVRYRRRVVRDNLLRAFPEWGSQRRMLRRVERQYYRHLCDLVAEGLYNLRASLRQVERRYRFENVELLTPFYEQGRSVVLLSAHYNNWEYMITSLDHRLRHHAVGVGKPLDNRRFGRFITARRARYGTEIVDQTDVRQAMEFYARHRVPVAYMMLSDQSPSNPHRSLWTDFLGQDTPFLFGAEHFARKYDMPVVLYDVRKLRRGRYSVRFRLMTDQPAALPEGDITRRYARHLEQQIRLQPQYWLWSHRRWKLTREGKILKDGTFVRMDDGIGGRKVGTGAAEAGNGER
ncbi:MAG: lysophospholipid acyltransferase family protein [Bacteroidales bacterium]|nr:lysophospholipid acyltransferase family protein [Bacteroidales bacterium]